MRLIHQHGYAAMSLRQLAREVGLQVGSLYNHIRTKQDLLFDLLRGHMESLLTALDQTLADAAGPEDALRRFVAFHVDYHITRKTEVFICYSELRSLEPDNYAIIVGMRRGYERRLIAILDEGVRHGCFRVGDAPVAAFGILAMLTGVCTWFRPDGRLTAADLIEQYTAMVLNAVREA